MPRSRRGNLHIIYQILHTQHGSSHVFTLSCVFPISPTFCCSFVFLVFIFWRPDESGLCTWPRFTVILPFFPSHQHGFSANHLNSFSILFFYWLSSYAICFVAFGKILLLVSIYYCPLTFLCLSVEFRGTGYRIGREETVHIKINRRRRRRRSQIWHQWYDGCALSTVKSAL